MPPAEHSRHLEVKDPPEFLVKICGITNLDDALSSVRLGANALGFNFYPKSPRYLEPEQVEKMLPEIPEHVLTVAVMVISGEDGLSAPSAVVKRVPSIGPSSCTVCTMNPIFLSLRNPFLLPPRRWKRIVFPTTKSLLIPPGAGEKPKTGMSYEGSTVLSSCREACGRGMLGKPSNYFSPLVWMSVREWSGHRESKMSKNSSVLWRM